MDKNYNNTNLTNEIIDLKKQLIFYKMKQNTKQDIKPHTIKNIKHKIAQILTLETNQRQKD